MTKQKTIYGGTGAPIVASSKNGRTTRRPSVAPSVPGGKLRGPGSGSYQSDGSISRPSLSPGVGADIFGAMLNLGASYLSSEISGSVSEKYQKRAEDRADERYRQLLVDEPGLTFQGRLAAGLNPYGDADVPGMVAQSNPDTSSDFNGDFLGQVIAREQLGIARQQLENDTILARSQAEKNLADADAIKGGEERADESFEYNLANLIESVRGSRLENEMKEIDLEIKEYTKPNQMALSDLELSEAQYSIAEQIANIALSNATIEEKKASTQKLIQESVYLQAQTALAKAGVSLTLAQTQEVWQKINNLKAEELVALAQHKVTLEEVHKIKAEIANIDARTREIPATSRVERNRMRFQNINNTIDTFVRNGLQLYSALATGGVSTAVSNIVTSVSPG